jgi:hypothetical protein
MQLLTGGKTGTSLYSTVTSLINVLIELSVAVTNH